MYELIVLLSRYLFLFLIISFLWQCISFILNERGYLERNPKSIVFKQRIILSLLHISAFTILSYIQGEGELNLDTFLFAGGSLLVFIIFWLSTTFIFKYSDILMWNCVTFLLDVSLIILYRLNHSLAMKQFIWISISLIITLLLPIILRIISKFEYLESLYLIGASLLLISTFIFGDTKNGATNWIIIKEGYGFQPSEIVKFLFIFYLASVFRKKIDKKKFIVCTSISASFVLCLVLQKDLGGALIFFMTYMIMMYISINNAVLLFVGMAGVVIASFFSYFLFSHVKIRVLAWLNPWNDVNGYGYQIIQSIFAIGTYGLLGSGLTRGYPKSIPVVDSDFIFSAICEEFGAFFGICLIGIFIVIFYRGVHIALRSNRRFYSLICAGITNMLAFQTFLILGGVTKLIPLTGVTLPFISYGGSSILVSLIMIGFLQWIYGYYKKRELRKEELKDDES